MRSWLGLACVLALSNLSLAIHATAGAGAEASRFMVEETKGSEVWVQRGGNETKEALAKGSALAVNDIIVTGDGSHAVITLLDGSKVSVGPFTQYQLLKAEGDHGLLQWSFRLIVGTVRALVRKAIGDNPLSRFKIHTATGTAGVRGTEFVVTFNKEGDRMDVYALDGKVYLGPPGAEATNPDAQMIEKNRSRSIGKDGKPTKHKAFIRKEFLKTLDERGFPELSLGLDLSAGVLPAAGGAIANSSAAKSGDPSETADGKPVAGESSVEAVASAKLFEAAVAGNTGAVKSLLGAGADPNYKGESGATPLMAAAKGRHTLAMKALLDAKATPDAQDNRGHTPLIYATRWGDLEGVVLMRAVDADLSLKSAEGYNAEEYAQRRGEKDIIKFLRAWRAELSGAPKAAKQLKRERKQQ